MYGPIIRRSLASLFAAAMCATSTLAFGQAASPVNHQIDTVLGDHAVYEPVIKAFQAAVAQHDAEAVAALVSSRYASRSASARRRCETRRPSSRPTTRSSRRPSPRRCRRRSTKN